MRRLLMFILSCSFISDISHIATIRVRVVRHMLDTSIRKSYGVGSLNIAVTITVLLSIECCPSIVIMHSVLIGIGRGFVTV